MITFEESGLRPELLRAIADMGFEKPTPVQAQTLPLLQSPPANLIALAQTGTGKTAGFGLPLLHRIDSSNRTTQALILCPTRELCLQITGDFADYTKYLPDLKVTAIYGGAPIYNQAKQLERGSHVVVGTPGRVVDMISRGALKIADIGWFILDEADEMLNMGFKDDLETIFNETPKDKATWLFSATMPPKVESISKRYMKDAVRISVGKRNEGAANVSHEYYMVHARDRFEALRRIVALHDEFYGVVFCRTRQETTDVASKLISMGYPAEAISGALSQQQRDSVMKRFRTGQLKLLIATDVAARGIDVDDLTHVINFNLPDDPEVYVHRSGRTGRAGKSGVSVSIIHGKEKWKIRDLEKMTGKTFDLKQVPTTEEIGRGKVLAQVKEMLDTKLKGKSINYVLSEIYLLMEGMNREEIIEQLVKWIYSSAVAEENASEDINLAATAARESARKERNDGFDRPSRRERPERGERGERGERKPRRAEDGSGSFTRLDFNVGAKQNVNPGRLMGLINEVMRNASINFGKIEIDPETCAIDVDSKHAPDVAIALEGTRFGSKQLKVELGDKPLGKLGRPPKGESENRGGFGRSGSRGFDKPKSRSGGKYKSGTDKNKGKRKRK